MPKHLTKIILVMVLILGALPLAAEEMPQSRAQIALSFAPLVKQVAPAVVNIYTKKLVRQRISPLLNDPFFQQFFGGGMPEGFSRQRMENSLGSGVIVRRDGLIVTSNHVIAGADEIRVVLSDRREMDARVLMEDEASDLAVVRVDFKGGDLPFLELTDSDKAQIGDLVLAIGNPFGVGQTVTSGIISAFAQRALGKNQLDYFIQTDAAINPGNSGGALVTMDGRLVGINAAIYSRDGGNMGIGFAVPANMVRVVLSAAEQGKKNITRPWIGIEGQEVTGEIASSLGLSRPSGMLVKAVNKSSAAVKAGLRVGDVITMVNGSKIDTPEAFNYRIATMPIGQNVTLGISRIGAVQELRMPLMAPPEIPARESTFVKGENPLAGAVIQNLSPAVAIEMGMKDVEQGVVVSDVKDDAIASNVGINVGDIILAINGTKTPAVREVLDAVRTPQHSWRILLNRGGNTVNLMVGR